MGLIDKFVEVKIKHTPSYIEEKVVVVIDKIRTEYPINRRFSVELFLVSENDGTIHLVPPENLIRILDTEEVREKMLEFQIEKEKKELESCYYVIGLQVGREFYKAKECEYFKTLEEALKINVENFSDYYNANPAGIFVMRQVLGDKSRIVQLWVDKWEEHMTTQIIWDDIKIETT